jgi:cytoskeletal protein CcmA (bactofilin family)
MEEIKRATTDWRARLEPMLIEENIAAPPQTELGTPQLGHARSRTVDLNSSRAEEPSKMVEQADDLSPKMSRPVIGNKLPPPVAIPSRPSPAGANGSASPQHTSEGSSPDTRGHEVDRRTLIIGQGIALTGEVNSCDRLVVEGSIHATLQKCQHVVIAETGLFNGHASTENADVRGRFDGDLVVRKRLLIRAGGHVSGTVTYGEIEIESGGGISGTIEKAGDGNADLISLSA